MLVHGVWFRKLISLFADEIASHQDISLNVPTWLCTILASHELSPCLCPNPISVWYSRRDAICQGKSLKIHWALNCCSVMSRSLHVAGDTVCIFMTVVPWNPASFHCVMVNKSPAAFAIVGG